MVDSNSACVNVGLNSCKGEEVMKFGVVATVIGLLVASPTAAAEVLFTVGGTLESFDSDFGRPASTALLTAAPIGSSYRLDFRYDTASPSTFRERASASYSGATTASFTIAGTSFDLEPIVAVGNGPFVGTRFSLFGNVPFNEARINGLRPIDFSLDLRDMTGAVLTTPALPSTLNLEDFDSARLRVRFFGFPGETTALFTVSSLAAMPVSAVPEPASWAMMLLGFGACGAVMRRGKNINRKTAAVLNC